MQKNTLKKFILGILIFIFLVEIAVLLKTAFVIEKPHLNATNALIGHAFYGINGNAHTNSKEAFLEGYRNGLRFFEVDCVLTKDNKIVLAHNWEQNKDYNGKIPTEEEFLKTKILGKYTPMSFIDLLNLMEEYPDITIITDSKYANTDYVTKEFHIMLQEVQKLNKVYLLNRFMIQIYDETMYETVQKIYPFENMIFSLYQRWQGDQEEFEAICSWSKKHNLKAITIWNSLCTNQIMDIAKKYQVNICVHTENNVRRAINFLNNGVSAIYTDKIKIEDIS